MSPSGLQYTRSTHKNPLYFSTVAMSTLKMQLGKQFHLQEHQNKTIIYSEITLSKKVKH